jgi:cytoskeletal protein RodZ
VDGEGPETSTAGEGTDTSIAGRRLAVTSTWADSDAGGITTSQFSDDGRATESSLNTTTTFSPLGPASVDVTRASREADTLVVASPSSKAAAGTGGGGVMDASAAAADTSTSSACGAAGLVLGG